MSTATLKQSEKKMKKKDAWTSELLVLSVLYSTAIVQSLVEHFNHLSSTLYRHSHYLSINEINSERRVNVVNHERTFSTAALL